MTAVSGRRVDHLGTIFTDADGRVVFVNREYSEHFSTYGLNQIVGKPLHTVLLYKESAIHQFLQEIAEIGCVQNVPIEINTTSNQAILVYCTATATYNAKNQFIGADFFLYAEPSEGALPSGIAELLSAEIKQIQSNPLEHYLMAQINVLEVLLGRLAGPRVRKSLDDLIIKLCKGWPIQEQNGQFIVTGTISSDVCQSLLDKVVNYVISIVGRRVALHELKSIDEHFDTFVLKLAEQNGLRRFLHDFE